MGVNKAKLASELVGFGSGGGSLEKLTIRYRKGKRKKKEQIEALFNPSEIGISRSVTYEQKKVANRNDSSYFDVVQKLKAVEAATLDIELFFDTYEARDESASWKRAAMSALTPTNPFQTGDASDVTERTDEVAKLAVPDKELHRPPICHLEWGSFDIFTGVLTSLSQRFTMFLEDGTPVRATLSCGFVEYRTEANLRAGELHSADVAKTHTVRRHDTLQSIAGHHYDDPSLWRVIARANRIANPRHLAPGTTLLIPKLRP
jgi:nucleoid-associated protein YgaU